MARYDYHSRNIGDGYYASRPAKKKNRLARAFFLLIIFAGISGLFIYVFPEVEVTLVPETETVEHDFDVRLDANLAANDLLNNKIKGQIIRTEDWLKKEFPTSGEKNVGEKANGPAVFFNQTGLEQALTKDNSLVTDDGVVFYVKQDVVIPKAEVSAEGNVVYGNIQADIIAKEAGEEGNVAAGRLTITDLPFSKQNKIYGEIKTKLTGGTSQVIKVVSADDLKNAEENIKTELEPRLKRKLQDGLGPAVEMKDELTVFEVTGVEKTVELEEQIEKFEIKVSASAKALVWDVEEVKNFILKKIEAEIASDKKMIKTSADIFEVKVEEFNVEQGSAKLKIHTRNQISMPIEMNALRDEIKGMTEFEARRFLLDKQNIRDVRFKFRYSIMSKIPKNANRINIRLNI